MKSEDNEQDDSGAMQPVLPVRRGQSITSDSDTTQPSSSTREASVLSEWTIRQIEREDMLLMKEKEKLGATAGLSNLGRDVHRGIPGMSASIPGAVHAGGNSDHDASEDRLSTWMARQLEREQEKRKLEGRNEDIQATQTMSRRGHQAQEMPLQEQLQSVAMFRRSPPLNDENVTTTRSIEGSSFNAHDLNNEEPRLMIGSPHGNERQPYGQISEIATQPESPHNSPFGAQTTDNADMEQRSFPRRTVSNGSSQIMVEAELALPEYPPEIDMEELVNRRLQEKHEASVQREVEKRLKEVEKNTAVAEIVRVEEHRDGHNPGNWQRKRKRIIVCAPLICLGCFAIALTVIFSAGNRNTNEGPPRDVSFPTMSQSSEPTAAPTSARFGLLMDVLTDNAVVSSDVVKDPSSPQFQTLDWMCKQDDYSISMMDDFHTGQATDRSSQSLLLTERFIVALLYHATDGARWEDNLNFLNTTLSVCDWQKPSELEPIGAFDPVVIATENLKQRPFTGIECNDSNSIVAIAIPDNNLFGNIPTELSKLRNLEYLDFRENKLLGTLPTEFGSLPSFGAINTNGASSLQEIHLGFNLLTGSIPTEYGALAWSTMTIFSVQGNSLTGGIPIEFGGLVPPISNSSSTLRVLELFENRLFGPIPSEIGLLSGSLMDLDLGNNKLSGTVPTELGRLSKLLNLALEGNSMEGTIPVGLASMTDLIIFDFYSNGGITGSIPTELVTLSTNLIWFDVGKNKLTGTIPSDLSLFTNLEMLGLDNNMFHGTLPSDLGRLSKLKELYISHNELTGTVPIQYGNITLLQGFRLEENYLTGSLDSIFCTPSEFSGLDEFSADCGHDGAVTAVLTGANTSVICSCCTECY